MNQKILPLLLGFKCYLRCRGTCSIGQLKKSKVPENYYSVDGVHFKDAWVKFIFVDDVGYVNIVHR